VRLHTAVDYSEQPGRRLLAGPEQPRQTGTAGGRHALADVGDGQRRDQLRHRVVLEATTSKRHEHDRNIGCERRQRHERRHQRSRVVRHCVAVSRRGVIDALRRCCLLVVVVVVEDYGAACCARAACALLSATRLLPAFGSCLIRTILVEYNYGPIAETLPVKSKSDRRRTVC